ncbi:hypothetical protein HQ45_05850 [Porphyromonas crevioricanis]|nr:hypothetical protein HQ45_05850 [Porphyromonas crevioricanis]
MELDLRMQQKEREEKHTGYSPQKRCCLRACLLNLLSVFSDRSKRQARGVGTMEKKLARSVQK